MYIPVAVPSGIDHQKNFTVISCHQTVRKKRPGWFLLIPPLFVSERHNSNTLQTCRICHYGDKFSSILHCRLDHKFNYDITLHTCSQVQIHTTRTPQQAQLLHIELRVACQLQQPSSYIYRVQSRMPTTTEAFSLSAYAC